METGDEHKDPASAEAVARMPVFERRPFSPRTLGNRPQGRWVSVLFGAKKEPEKKIEDDLRGPKGTSKTALILL